MTYSKERSPTFPPAPESVGQARRFVTAVAGQWGMATDDAVLVASELASNAVLHARTDFTLTLQRHGGRVRLEVADANPRWPVAMGSAPGASSGWGLVLTTQLVLDWGVQATPTGKVVWCELALGHDAPGLTQQEGPAREPRATAAFHPDQPPPKQTKAQRAATDAGASSSKARTAKANASAGLRPPPRAE